MKKIKLIFFLALIAFALQAQEESAVKTYDRFIGGSLSLFINDDAVQTANNLNQTKRSFSFFPTMGLYIDKKNALGASLGYSHSEREFFGFNFPPDVQINRSYSIGVFWRYTVNPNSIINFVVVPNLNYNSTVSKLKGVDDKTRGYQVNLGVNFGLTWEVSQRLRLLTTIGGLRSTIGNFNTEFDETYSQFSLDFGLNFFTFGAEFKY